MRSCIASQPLFKALLSQKLDEAGKRATARLATRGYEVLAKRILELLDKEGEL